MAASYDFSDGLRLPAVHTAFRACVAPPSLPVCLPLSLCSSQCRNCSGSIYQGDSVGEWGNRSLRRDIGHPLNSHGQDSNLMGMPKPTRRTWGGDPYSPRVIKRMQA